MTTTTYKVFAGSTAGDTHAASAAIIEKNGNIDGQAYNRILPAGTTNPAALLDAYALGMAEIPASEFGKRVLLVCTTPWMVQLGNQHLAALLDDHYGITATGKELANIPAWKRLRAAAKRLGGLVCDGGNVLFIEPQTLDDRKHTENARRQAKKARKEAQRYPKRSAA